MYPVLENKFARKNIAAVSRGILVQLFMSA